MKRYLRNLTGLLHECTVLVIENDRKPRADGTFRGRRPYGVQDILLHVTCLRRDGFQTAYEGARVVCEVLDRPKGMQAFRVL